VVVGYDGFGGCGNNVAFRWTQATGQVSLGFPPGGNYSIAYATNANGKVVVGDAALCGSRNQAVRWTAATGWVNIGNLPGAIASQAVGVNADGSVVVGPNYFSGGTRQAFRWTAASGTIGLGFLPGGNTSGAAGVSANGTVVVGGSNGTGGASQAFRWTAATGRMVGLGFLPGATDNVANRAHAGVVVGDSGGKAFLWTDRNGMKSIQDLLSAAGANVTGWQLTSARGVSANCTVITISGQGIDPSGNNQGWIATLPRSAHDCDTGEDD
jgi:probable HAF family extracellular repeat protein